MPLSAEDQQLIRPEEQKAPYTDAHREFLVVLRHRYMEHNKCNGQQALAWYPVFSWLDKNLQGHQKLINTRAGAQEVISIARDNIDKILERGEKLEVLVEKTLELSDASRSFKHAAKDLRKSQQSCSCCNPFSFIRDWWKERKRDKRWEEARRLIEDSQASREALYNKYHATDDAALAPLDGVAAASSTAPSNTTH